jgi:uncharacterized protein with GYD domain
MRTYIAQVDVRGETVQNPQEFVTAWGTIQEDVEVLGGEVVDTYALLGEDDFHVLFRVEDTETALQVTQIIESEGFDTTTMEAIPLDQFGELVEDV